MHSGINTGLVVTADVNPEKGTHGITGDAINVAARLPDMEIGKRFSEKKSKNKQLNGISAEDCLRKARKMFQEIDLQWDLDQLDKIAS